jgi:hypothetical protein
MYDLCSKLGKMEEIAVVLKRYKIQVTELQEMKWPRGGWIKKKLYNII